MSISTRYILSFFWVFSFLVQAQAQQVRPYPMEEKSVLWKAVHPEKKGEIYLFGTMHLIEKEYFYFPKKLQKLIESAELIVMELPGLPNPMEVMNLVRLENGSLFDYFSPEQRDSILQWAKNDLQLDSAFFCASFGKMKPFVIAQMTTEMEFKGSTESYEINIEQIAKAKDIPLRGLETVEEQMGFFDAMSIEDQREMVMQGVRGDSEVVSIRELEELYQAQDLDGLFKKIVESDESWSYMENELIKNRNYNWLNQMPGFFTGQKVFVAVGAGHLGGPEGLIRLMEEQGYLLSPVEL